MRPENHIYRSSTDNTVAIIRELPLSTFATIQKAEKRGTSEPCHLQPAHLSTSTRALATLRGRSLRAILAFAAIVSFGVGSAVAQVSAANGITLFTAQDSPTLDFVNAKPMQLPTSNSQPDTVQATIQALLSSIDLGPSGGSDGYEGSGEQSPVFLGTPAHEDTGSTFDSGTSNHPFTTVRADFSGLNTNTTYPFRAAGKLYFKVGSSTAWCSASLIKKGVVVTAAHCVANYGKKQFYSGWTFTPGYRNGSAPYGVFTGVSAAVLTTYYNGTDGCYVYGVICPNDVAVVVLNGTPGTNTGVLGYFYGGGFTTTNLAQITQLGYPSGLDYGAYMERNDSYGYKNSTYSNNTIIGSNMNGGSSGGPWVENVGLPSALTGETNGSFPNPNVVVGVTSWGYTSNVFKEQGASSFTSSNISPLVSVVCMLYPSKC